MSERPHECVAAIIRNGDRILLCHRTPDRHWYPNVWDLPGGHRAAHEAPTAALARELHEELGISMPPTEQPPFEVLRDDHQAIELSIWLIDYNGPLSNCAQAEHDELRWVTHQELRDLPLAHPAYMAVLTRGFQ